MYCNDDSSLRRSVQAKPREMGERKGGERPGHEGGERTLSERLGMHFERFVKILLHFVELSILVRQTNPSVGSTCLVVVESSR